MKLAAILTAGLLALTTSPTAEAKCAQPRVRRPWTQLLPAERELYKDAIAMAMDTGKYIKFVEGHDEFMSELEGHRQCMFFYWHRYFITAFENMLRDLDPRFECVTLPYWDWITDYSKLQANECSNILDCSPTLNFLGGRAPVSEGMRNVTINGVSMQGYCEADHPMNHFCHNSVVAKSECLGCVPRGDWLNATFPASAAFASIRSQLFEAKNLVDMQVAIETGPHNLIHFFMNGAMLTNESPSDPVFWSHHAMVDLLHSIFHKCKVGEQKMTFEEKVASVDWAKCERNNGGGTWNPTDYVTSRTGYMGINPINATEDPLVGKYFSVLPQQFGALVDTRDLGESSYTYAIDSFNFVLYTECGATNVTDHASTTAAVERSLEATTSDSTQLPTMGELANTTLSSTAKKILAWVDKTDREVAARGGNARVEAEQKTCLFQDECLGGVVKATEELRKMFHFTGEARCDGIVDEIHRTVDAKTVAEWKAEMTKTFGCPKPKTATK